MSHIIKTVSTCILTFLLCTPVYAADIVAPSTDITPITKFIIELTTKVVLPLCDGLALLAVVVGGFMYATSAGNEEQIKKAKATIFWAISGLVVALIAQALVNLIQNDIFK